MVKTTPAGLLLALQLASTMTITSAAAQSSTPSIAPRKGHNLNSILNSSAGSTFLSQSVIPQPESGSKQPAQVADASISGKITDETKQRAIAEARVVLTKAGEEHKRFEGDTAPDGTYKIDKIEPGKYVLTVSAPEMISTTQNIELASGEQRSLDVPLEDIEPVDVLRITGKRTLIHPDNIGSETDLDHKFVYQYKTGNDLRDLITSTPGTMNDSYGNIITRGEHNSINYVVDDVVIPEAAGVLQQSQVISPRSMQSMAVDIGGYEASDGGGPLGAVAHIKSLPISPKPNFNIGQQIGGPLAGSIFYNTSGAFSQKDEFWKKWRFESSGSFRSSSYGIAPPVKDYVHNNRVDLQSFTKIEFLASPRDTFRLTTAINETTFQTPTSGLSASAGVKDRQSDGQNYMIASWIHRFDKWLDEANLHILNGIYYERFRSSLAFDPGIQFNNGQPEVSISANAKRFNYIFSAQGNLIKNYRRTHLFKAGFLTELRPNSTFFNATYFNADLLGSIPSASNPNPTPYGAVISPFTLTPTGPMFNGNIGKYSGFRWLQSFFVQDKFTPQNGFWRRLTLDGGVRFDMQHSVDGNTLGLVPAILSVPGAGPFAVGPFQKQIITDAQVSGRYGAAFVVAKNTVLRSSFSNLFMPNPNDIFVTPFLVGPSATITGGIYDGTPRPLHATRGYLVDTSLEKQFGPRFNWRTNLFYKYITNFGDSGVVGNLPLYNRLTNSAQDAYGVETRIDFKPARDGYGLNGFLSNTVQVAYLRGTHTPSGGFYATPTPPFMKFPDHDRRLSTVAGLGYKTRQNLWWLFTAQVLSGLQDERDPAIYGPHPQRTPFITDLAWNAGYVSPREFVQKHKWFPSAFDVRVDNILNQRLPVNLGSPFQGTRFNLPIRVLASVQWQLGKEEAKLAAVPKPNI